MAPEERAEYQDPRRHIDKAGNLVYGDERDRGRPWIELLTVVAGLTALVLWPSAVGWVITALLIALGIEILVRKSH